MSELSDIYEGTLQRMNVIGVGQTPTAAQIKILTRNMVSLHEYLLDNEYVNYDIDDVPARDDDSVITLLAYRSRLDFSISQERAGDLRNEVRRAYQVLFSNNQVKDSANPTKAVYF